MRFGRQKSAGNSKSADIERLLVNGSTQKGVAHLTSGAALVSFW